MGTEAKHDGKKHATDISVQSFSPHHRSAGKASFGFGIHKRRNARNYEYKTGGVQQNMNRGANDSPTSTA